MNEAAIIDKITALAQPLAASLGLELWGMEFGFGGKSMIRIFVEKSRSAADVLLPAAPESDDDNSATDDAFTAQHSVSIEECAKFSRLLGLSLEVEDVYNDPYVLEVSSPGLERTFFTADQLRTFMGNPVELHLLDPNTVYPGRRKFTGILTDEKDGIFSLLPEDGPAPDMEPQSICFTWGDIKKARLVHIFPDTSAPVKKSTSKAKPTTKTDSEKARSGAKQKQGKKNLRATTETEAEKPSI